MRHFVPFIVSLFVTSGGLFSKLTTGFCDCYTLTSAQMLHGVNIADEIAIQIHHKQLFGLIEHFCVALPLLT